MLLLNFAGWFQARLATDPDPTDEPRGVSGFTFALAGEPDFDRVIRFHHPVAPRSHGPQVGVFVTSVSMAGQEVFDHPLLRASAHLLGDAKFESRNYVVRDGSMGPIDPFHLQICGHEVILRRKDLLYPDDPDLKLHLVPPAFLARRGSLMPMMVDRIRIADATGITDPIAYRQKRRELLQADLQQTADPVMQAALAKRIRELDITDPRKLQILTLSYYNEYRFDLNGPAEIIDPHNRLRGIVDTAQDWPLAFWMGGWDSDALCAYVRGMLTIPFTPFASD
ncbi:MAG TPA: hypothetical protein VI542_09335 [Candidatus Tectomicrobia bacterium]